MFPQFLDNQFSIKICSTYPLQITDPPRTYLCRPRLEQYIVFQLSSSLTSSIQMSYRVTGNYPRRTPIPHQHSAFNLEPIREFIYRLTDNFFRNCSTHPKPLVRQIGNYIYPISTSSTENIYTNGLNVFCCNLSPSGCSGCSVFSIVIIFHC